MNPSFNFVFFLTGKAGAMIDLTVKTLDSRNHAFSVPDDVSIVCLFLMLV